MRPVIVLLDLDGVLVQPGGYRAAVDASVRYLANQLGLNLPDPGPGVPALFEALGITSEWDMVPICAVILLNSVSDSLACQLPDLHLEEMFPWARAKDLHGFCVNYAEKIQQLGPIVGNGILPSEVLFSAIQTGAARSIFPNLFDQPFLSDLLAETRNLAGSLTTSLVQNYVLGNEVFYQTYAISPKVEVESTLEKYDRTNLDPLLARRLLKLRAEGQIYLSAYTARPSLPARDSGILPAGFSPESEMALRLVGLEEIALIGYGRLEAFGRQVGAHPDKLLKPAPFQPIAAATAAYIGSEQKALQWAYSLLENMHMERAPSLSSNLMPVEIDLHIFEDAAIGIRAAMEAVHILKHAGITVSLYRWGIATTLDKQTALLEVEARIFPDVNSAMQEAFRNLL